MGDDLNAAARAELRRRTRRIGLAYAACAPIVGLFFALLSRPLYGAVLGTLTLALGLDIAFVFAPFAAWLKSREQSRM